jgi:hypothetical protein
LTRSRGHYQAHQSGRIGFTFDDPYHRDQPGSVDERGAVASQLSHLAVELGTVCPTSSTGGSTCQRTCSRNTCTIYTPCSPISCTACRATSSGTAASQCWCCPMTYRASAADLDRCRLAGAKCRDHDVPMKGVGGAEATHDRPGAPLLERARADALCRAIDEAARRVRATITRCMAASAFRPRAGTGQGQ